MHMTILRVLRLLVPALLLCSTAAGQLRQSFEKLIGTFDQYYSSNPLEKIYVHTDKPYYAVGDTIWLKAYVLEGEAHMLASRSKAVYVELINDAESVVSSLKLPMLQGMAAGSFLLNNDLLEGNYRLRAYTQWMRNEGPIHFFDHVFQVGDASDFRLVGQAELEEQNGRKYINVRYKDRVKELALVGQRVEYLLNTGGRYYTGKGQTDEQGSLRIDISRHAGDSVFRLESTLLTEDETVVSKFLLRQFDGEAEVLFFPEGGELIQGIRTRVAVKATGSNGRGLEVLGTVRDQDGNRVAEWKTAHAGMGSFYLDAAAGKQYTATLVFEDGRSNTYALPQAMSAGLALSVIPEVTADSVMVRVLSSLPDGSARNISLLVQSSGKIIGTLPLKVDRPLVQAFIDKKLFRTGIAQFTLFDEQGKPFAERIAFIERPDTLQLAMDAIGPQRTRGNAVLDLTVKDAHGKPTLSNLSVAVIDESRISVQGYDENTIFAQILLRSDIRGYIENPSYYFDRKHAARLEHLDLLMLTQGYRKFDWQAMVNGTPPVPAFQPEPLTDDISGRLVNMRGKPVEGGQVIMHSNRLRLSLDTLTDNDGRFSFENFLIAGNQSFTIQGKNPRGRNTVEILMDKETKEPVSVNKNIGDLRESIDASMTAYINYQQDRDEEFGIPGSRMLKAVDIRGRRGNHLSIGGAAIPMSQIDHIIKLNPNDACKTMLDCIRQWVPNLRVSYRASSNAYQGSTIRPITGGNTLESNSAHQMTQNRVQRMESQNSGPSNGPMLLSNGYPMTVYLNGYAFTEGTEVRDMLMDKDTFDPAQIDHIYVKEFDGTGLSFQSFMYIRTKDETIRPPSFNPDVLVYEPQGYSYVREFYSPRYEGNDYENRMADFRSTIYWDADVTTDQSGMARLDYFNAARPGTYRVVVEGLNNEGQLGRTVFRYEVSE